MIYSLELYTGMVKNITIIKDYNQLHEFYQTKLFAAGDKINMVKHYKVSV